MQALGSPSKMNMYSTATMIIILVFSVIQPTLSDVPTSRSLLSTIPTSSSTTWPTTTTSSGSPSPTIPTSSSTTWPTTTTSSGSPSPTIPTSSSTTWPTTTTSSGSPSPTIPTSSSTTWPTTTTSSGSPSPIISTTVTSSGSSLPTPWPTRRTTVTSSGSSVSTPWPTGSTMTTTSTSPDVTSTYWDALTYTSPTFHRPNDIASDDYYYQAIQVTIYRSDVYTFTSRSSIDTYGCLYNGYFGPFNPDENLITCDDDSGGDYQFQINSTMNSGSIYILVVTTYRAGDLGSYSVIAVGPASVDMRVYDPFSTPTSWMTTSTSSGTVSFYQGSLNYYSSTFVRPDGIAGYSYYYQAVQVTTYTPGLYSFTSSSSIYTYGCLYDGYFDPLYPYENVITCDNDSGGDQQFQIGRTLGYETIYILVVTTYSPSITGIYSVIALGPGTVYMTTVTPSTTVPWPTSTTTSSTVTSNYLSSLRSDSPTFTRPYTYSDDDYYYDAIQITAHESDSYTLTGSSTTNIYGCLYHGTFDPSNPGINLVSCDNGGSSGDPFSITSYLYTNSESYTLIVTTYYPLEIGNYTVQVMGPAAVDMSSANPSPKNSIWTTVGIVTISCTAAVVLIVIVSVCIHRRRQQRPERQRLLLPNGNPNQSAQGVFAAGSPSQVGTNRTLYAVPRVTAPAPMVEEAPPSYEAFMASSPQQQPEP